MGEEGPDLYTLPLSEFRRRAAIGGGSAGEVVPVPAVEVPPPGDVSVQPGPAALGNRGSSKRGSA